MKRSNAPTCTHNENPSKKSKVQLASIDFDPLGYFGNLDVLHEVLKRMSLKSSATPDEQLGSPFDNLEKWDRSFINLSSTSKRFRELSVSLVTSLNLRSCENSSILDFLKSMKNVVKVGCLKPCETNLFLSISDLCEENKNIKEVNFFKNKTNFFKPKRCPGNQTNFEPLTSYDINPKKLSNVQSLSFTTWSSPNFDLSELSNLTSLSLVNVTTNSRDGGLKLPNNLKRLTLVNSPFSECLYGTLSFDPEEVPNLEELVVSRQYSIELMINHTKGGNFGTQAERKKYTDKSFFTKLKKLTVGSYPGSVFSSEISIVKETLENEDYRIDAVLSLSGPYIQYSDRVKEWARILSSGDSEMAQKILKNPESLGPHLDPFEIRTYKTSPFLDPKIFVKKWRVEEKCENILCFMDKMRNSIDFFDVFITEKREMHLGTVLPWCQSESFYPIFGKYEKDEIINVSFW